MNIKIGKREMSLGLTKSGRKDWKEMKKGFPYFAIIFSVFILICGVSMFIVGFHNMDTCHNEMGLEKEFNSEFLKYCGIDYDMNIREIRADGEIWELSECYIAGLNGIFEGFFISLTGMLIFGMTLGGCKIKW